MMFVVLYSKVFQPHIVVFVEMKYSCEHKYACNVNFMITMTSPKCGSGEHLTK